MSWPLAASAAGRQIEISTKDMSDREHEIATDRN
jgi:hypothetical protein